MCILIIGYCSLPNRYPEDENPPYNEHPWLLVGNLMKIILTCFNLFRVLNRRFSHATCSSHLESQESDHIVDTQLL